MTKCEEEENKFLHFPLVQTQEINSRFPFNNKQRLFYKPKTIKVFLQVSTRTSIEKRAGLLPANNRHSQNNKKDK